MPSLQEASDIPDPEFSTSLRAYETLLVWRISATRGGSSVGPLISRFVIGARLIWAGSGVYLSGFSASGVRKRYGVDPMRPSLTAACKRHGIGLRCRFAGGRRGWRAGWRRR